MGRIKKELAVDATNSTLPDKSELFDYSDDSTETSKSQEFQANSADYVQVVKDEEKGRHWTFIVYKDSAPADWIDQLINTGLAFAISPYHDKDINPNGSPKKAHWHLIVSYSNTTTYRSIKGLREITKGPFPLVVKSVSGMYAYFTHKHNPEKYPYDSSEIRRFNGWEKVLEASDVNHIMRELTRMILVEDIQEYAELIVECMFRDGDYGQVAMSHTHYFDRLCASYRHAPERILKRFYNVLESDEEREIVANRIYGLRKNGGKKHES